MRILTPGRFASATVGASPILQKGIKSLILLTIRWLWKTRNEVVFKEITPNMQDLVVSILEESTIRMLAGAKALPPTPALLPPDGML
jgi:hypothetical protein